MLLNGVRGLIKDRRIRRFFDISAVRVIRRERMPRLRPPFWDEISWEEKAQINPLYAVMSVDDFVYSDSQPRQEELKKFFKDGKRKVGLWIIPWLRETEVKTEMKILDFGCGMGRFLRSLAEVHPPENLYGLDLSKTMISHAREYLPEGINLAVNRDDGTWPYPDSTFDRVYSYAVFQHIHLKSSVIKSIREMSRVLKIGGKIKLQLAMVFPPPFESKYKRDTYAFEHTSLIFGWSTRFILPIWGFKLTKSNMGEGIRLGYKQFTRELKKNRIEIYGIRRETPRREMIWFYGEKV